uniref:Calpain catalytic domain-containing protein n=1 Tax=Chromera velia CCMP2878 TaxID=1169474 RepID=A0A0G4F9A5_9ALVE|eukprot:Cvel_15836.t1-p1 / transcript=Cvel_15836.t1 / gene=Cvel_15836 / organism=Chromera_velia_CCMP2878 / gene_product=Calpain-1 catalytic subunit, putative / transcript_product=Calpain-1 catalytic subunit, putative / location=Cvel_scaffold1190:28113-34345(+) / protein_length=826 / sequence_SO=supercontig / SO=protein_coding / is_pseudo=false
MGCGASTVEGQAVTLTVEKSVRSKAATGTAGHEQAAKEKVLRSLRETGHVNSPGAFLISRDEILDGADNLFGREEYFGFEGTDGWILYDLSKGAIASEGKLWICATFCSGDSRPLTVTIDGQEQPGKIATDTTGSFGPPLQWFLYGPFTFPANASELKLSTTGYWPHLLNLYAVPVPPPPAPPSPPAGGPVSGGVPRDPASAPHLDASFFLSPDAKPEDLEKQMRDQEGNWTGKRSKAYWSVCKNVDGKPAMDKFAQSWEERCLLPDDVGPAVVDAVNALCQAEGGKFYDWQFPPTDLSLVREPMAPERFSEGALWRRMSEFTDDPQVFVDGVRPEDACQGGTMNCHTVVWIANMAQHPEMLKSAIYPHTPHPGGCYGVRLWRRNEWVWVILDDFVPTRFNFRDDMRPQLVSVSSPSEREMWPTLVEKAMCKVMSSYQYITAGGRVGCEDSICLFGGKYFKARTGMLARRDNRSDREDKSVSAERVWEAVQGAMTHKYSMSSACGETTMGLVTFHAFSVLGGMEIDGVRLIRCRNPAGGFEWTGAWSDESKEWDRHPEAKKSAIEKFGAFVEDGAFWIPLHDPETDKDFLQFFDGLNICVPQYIIDKIGKETHPPGIPAEGAFSYPYETWFRFHLADHIDRTPYNEWRPEEVLFGADPLAVPAVHDLGVIPTGECEDKLGRLSPMGKAAMWTWDNDGRGGKVWIAFKKPTKAAGQVYGPPCIALVECNSNGGTKRGGIELPVSEETVWDRRKVVPSLKGKGLYSHEEMSFGEDFFMAFDLPSSKNPIVLLVCSNVNLEWAAANGDGIPVVLSIKPGLPNFRRVPDT